MLVLSLVLIIGVARSVQAKASCPRGLSGDACDRVAWPACIVGGLRFDCNHAAPCECFAQCDADHALGRYATVCYNATSDTYDTMLAAPTVVYPRISNIPPGGNDCPECEDLGKGSVRAPDADQSWIPLSLCPQGCNNRGACNSKAKCSCFEMHDSPGLPSPGNAATGESCSEVQGHKPCVDQTCGGHGHCNNGVCVCEDAGRHGVACELPPLKRRADPQATVRVFVYTLPPGFNTYRDIVAIDRNFGWLTWKALLHSPLRTHDPMEANYFFVPVFPMGSVSAGLLLEALYYVRATWPYWNDTTGHNHLVVGPYDFGLCGISGFPEFDRVVQLSHYGLTDPKLQQWCTCAMCGPSYRPGIDLVVPDTMEIGYKLNQAAPALSAARENLVFFSGRPTNEHRKRVYELSKSPGWRILQGTADLGAEMRNSVFCLDVGGAGFSTRFTLAVITGCIPLYLDELKQPWSDVLPLDDFSVSFSENEFGQLVDRVAGISIETVRTLQFHLARHRKAYHWTVFYGPLPGQAGDVGDAWDTLWKTLKMMVNSQ